MGALKGIAILLALALFFALMFYFVPKSMDRMRERASQGKTFPETIWWSTFGWIGTREGLTAILLFAIVFGLAAFLVNLKPQ
jgi:hypothetical protein